MYIPIVPVVPHTAVINKTIVYSDTVLPLKGSGSNFKVTTVSDVGEYALESCLKEIFESNPNVVFNTIQYSKQDRKVYFYTDKEISTEIWKESKFTQYKPLSNSKEILEEVKSILSCEKPKNNDCISLYEVANLIKKFQNRYDCLKKKYTDYLKEVLRREWRSSLISVYDFDYSKEELCIWAVDSFGVKEIYFKKQEQDLYVTKSEAGCLKNQRILNLIGQDLSKLYDEFMKFSEFQSSEHCYDIKPLNCSFLVNISKFGVDIFAGGFFNKDFKLSSHSSFENEYDYECNSTLVVNTIQGQENEIFRRIFVRIDDCPKWSRETLYQIRQNQLAEEQKIEERRLEEEQRRLEEQQRRLEEQQRIEAERQYKEMKKQKRLNRIFPFRKNK